VLLGAIRFVVIPQEFHKNPRNLGVFEVALCYGLTVKKMEKYSLDIFRAFAILSIRDSV